MALEKCPRCELNYILDGEKLCTVCRREVRGEAEPADVPELCSECGEHPSILGGELCIFCRKEMARRMAASGATDDASIPEDPTIEIDSVSSMEEIELDIGDGMAEEFEAGEEFKEEDDADEAEDDEMTPLSIDDMKEQDDFDEEEDE